jgi:predicted MFS family arabinose efflux permease
VELIASIRSLGPRYRALWVGQALAQFGTYVAFFSIPLLIRFIQGPEGSTLDYAFAYALENVPIILTGLVGGVLLDRWHLRPVMVATHLIRASAFFYLSASVGEFGVGTVFLIAFLLGSMSTLFDGALYSILPSLVKKDQLPRANSLITATIQANFALGPLIAGVLAAVFAGPEVGLFLTGLLFVGAAASLKGVGRVAHHRSPTDTRASFVTEAANGLKYVWAEPRLRITTIAAAIPNLVIGFIEGTWIVLYYTVIGVRNEAELGLLLSMMGVGGVIGAFIAPSVTNRIGLGRALIVGMAIAGTGMFAFMFSRYGVVAILLQIVWMAGISIINIPLATVRQIYSSVSMLGRVITASRAIGWATVPLGAILGGWLGATPDTYPWVARMFPLILVATALWLFTTVIWSDTFGPEHEGGRHLKREPEPLSGSEETEAVDPVDPVSEAVEVEDESPGPT